jgi:hypothetical protein
MKTVAFTRSLLLILILLLGQSYSQVDMIAHDECGVEFLIPKTWEHEIDEDLLIVQSPEGKLKLFFLTSGIQVLGQVSDALLEEISRVITQPEVASVSRQGEHNDLIYYDAQGFGLYEREIVDWELRFVAGARKSMMIIALGDLEANRHEIDQIYDTIQLTKLPPTEEP